MGFFYKYIKVNIELYNKKNLLKGKELKKEFIYSLCQS